MRFSNISRETMTEWTMWGLMQSVGVALASTLKSHLVVSNEAKLCLRTYLIPCGYGAKIRVYGRSVE